MIAISNTCSICCEVFQSSEKITVNEDLVNLLTFLMKIDTRKLENTLICETCSERIQEACTFKIILLENIQNVSKANREKAVDKTSCACHICKNDFDKLSSSSFTDESKRIINYYLADGLDLKTNKDYRVCIACQQSTLNLHSVIKLLSNCDKNNIFQEEITIEDVVINEDGEVDMETNYHETTEETHQQNDKTIRTDDICKTTNATNHKCNVKEKVKDININDINRFTCKECTYQSKPKSNFKKHLLIVIRKDIDGIKTLSHKVSEEPKKLKRELKKQSNDNIKKRLLIVLHRNIDGIKRSSHQVSENSTKTKQALKNHKSADDHKLFKCGTCKFKTKTNQHFQTHLLKHKNIEKCEIFQCNICEFRSKYIDSIYVHYMKLHNVIYKRKLIKYKCNVCDYKTNNKERFKKHLLTHKNIEECKMFKCDTCKFKTTTLRHFQSHLLIHTNIEYCEIFQCNVCYFQTNHTRNIFDHYENLHNINLNVQQIKEYKCSSCNYKTHNIKYLKKHLLRHINIDEYKIFKNNEFRTTHKSINNLQVYQCDYCDHETNNKYYKQHLLTHKSIEECDMFTCDVCQFQTKYKYSLSLHKRLHNNATKTFKHKIYNFKSKLERKCNNENEVFICNICNFRTSTQSVLKTHALTHKDISQIEGFTCYICNFTAKTKHGIRRHLSVHKVCNNIQRFVCDSCYFRTAIESDLKKHMIVHNDQMFICDICKFQTKRKSKFETHMLVHRGMRPEAYPV